MSDEPKILIGSPVGKDCLTDLRFGLFCGRMAGLGTADFISKNSSETEHGRNLVVQHFLEKKQYEYLFFLDCDEWPKSFDILDELVGLDKDVVAGVAKMILDGRRYWSAARFVNEEGLVHWCGVREMPKMPFKAVAVGGGSMLIKRRVLEALKWPWFETIFKEDGTRIGEDIYFSNKVIEAGFEIWVDPSQQYGHSQRRDISEL